MTTIKFRRDTSVNWTSVNPIPAQGEPCYETDTGKLKIGNGSDNYVALPYVSDGGGSSGDLPIATATTLGGIKVGNNLSITEDGTLSANGGGTGTTDYTQLENKPQINSVELTGNKTLDDLGIQAKGDYLTALPDNAVTTDTTQEITGDKTFTKTITTANITCNNTLMASTIRTKANGTIKLAHPTNNVSGMITLDNNYGQLSITNGLSGNDNLLQVVSGTAYATLMGNKIETKDKNGNVYTYINSKNITNCLLEVPQRIKLELNDGTLTLKAGSQVIVPNGFEADGTTPKFDEVVVENDLTMTSIWGTAEKMAIFVSSNATSIYMVGLARLSSGTTAPTTTDTRYWYDTDTNLVKNYSGGSYTGGNRSFPIAICTKTSTSNDNLLASIDQVFNGMGYIGSTVWVDKGVKGLIPNGRNEDGTLNNIEFTVGKVRTYTNTVARNNSYLALSADDNHGVGRVNEFEVSDDISQSSASKVIYSPTLNKNIISGGTEWKWAIVGQWSSTSTSPFNVTSLQPKQPFRAVDYNDKSEISSWSLPSTKYIDLTLGASGSTYTAPANGFVYFAKNASKSGQWFQLANKGKYSINLWSSGAGQTISDVIECLKGDVITIDYTLGSQTGTLRFIYAEGSK